MLPTMRRRLAMGCVLVVACRLLCYIYTFVLTRRRNMYECAEAANKEREFKFTIFCKLRSFSRAGWVWLGEKSLRQQRLAGMFRI